jgi:hypothetical protein
MSNQLKNKNYRVVFIALFASNVVSDEVEEEVYFRFLFKHLNRQQIQHKNTINVVRQRNIVNVMNHGSTIIS